MARTTTLKGNPLTLAGAELKVGDKAPEATLKKDLVNNLKISDSKGRNRIFSVVPSLDTPVCALQTKRFYEEAVKQPSISIYTISADLPPAQNRFCGAEGIDREKMTVLSDHKDTSFGLAYGTLVPELRINSRAVFVVDKHDVIRYAEYVPEIANHPNYDAILACAKAL